MVHLNITNARNFTPIKLEYQCKHFWCGYVSSYLTLIDFTVVSIKRRRKPGQNNKDDSFGANTTWNEVEFITNEMLVYHNKFLSESYIFTKCTKLTCHLIGLKPYETMGVHLTVLNTLISQILYLRS